MRSAAAASVFTFLLVSLSGCLTEDLPPHPSMADEEGDPWGPQDAAGVVPDWSVGDAWRYQVEGAWVPAPYVVTLGVIGETGSRYLIGADHPQEIAFDVLHGGLFTSGIDRERLAVWNEGGWQDLVGFGRAQGDTWSIDLYGQRFQMRMLHVAALPGPAGEAPGIRTIGTASEGHRILIDHQWEAGWVTRFEWTTGDRTILSYRMLGQAHDVTGLRSWDAAEVARAVAYTHAPVQTATWTSDGSADLLVLSAVTAAAPAGRATVWDPQVRARLAVVAQPGAVVQGHAVVDDTAGLWRVAATALGDRVDVAVHRVVMEPLADAEPVPTEPLDLVDEVVEPVVERLLPDLGPLQ